MRQENTSNFFEEVNFDNGLLPAVVQDYEEDRVLMLAYMNKEALEKTIEEQKAFFWSRSRQEIWMKGEESGNFQVVKEVRVDCDGDALLLKVEQKNGACHTGYFSCFFRKYKDGKLVVDEEKIFDPEKVYG